jgi:hypothetical protein
MSLYPTRTIFYTHFNLRGFTCNYIFQHFSGTVIIVSLHCKGLKSDTCFQSLFILLIPKHVAYFMLYCGVCMSNWKRDTSNYFLFHTFKPKAFFFSLLRYSDISEEKSRIKPQNVRYIYQYF